MKTYRTSKHKLAVLIFFGTVVALIMAVGKANALEVFLGIELIFLLMAFLAWSYTGIRFEDEDIIRSIFFLSNIRRPISAIKRMRFESDEDSFGGMTKYTIIEFRDGSRFFLFDFSRPALQKIVNRISSTIPNAVDKSLSNYLSREMTVKEWRTTLRPGDKSIFISGAVLVLLAIFWWLLQRSL